MVVFGVLYQKKNGNLFINFLIQKAAGLSPNYFSILNFEGQLKVVYTFVTLFICVYVEQLIRKMLLIHSKVLHNFNKNIKYQRICMSRVFEHAFCGKIYEINLWYQNFWRLEVVSLGAAQLFWWKAISVVLKLQTAIRQSKWCIVFIIWVNINIIPFGNLANRKTTGIKPITIVIIKGEKIARCYTTLRNYSPVLRIIYFITIRLRTVPLPQKNT